MNWIDYIKFYTTPKSLLVVIPKTAAPVRKCAIRLPDKYVWKDGKLIDIRLQWTHNVYEYVETKDDWLLLRDYFGGVIGRNRGDVLFEDEIVEYRVMILAA